MSTVPERTEIDEQYTWDLASIYPDDESWEDAYEDAEELIDHVRSMEGESLDDADSLLALLDGFERMSRTVATVAAYARHRHHEDTRTERYQAMNARVSALLSDAGSAASFIEPAIQELGRERIDELLEPTDELAVYDHHFDDILRAEPHTLDPEIEELLADLGEVTGAPGDIYSQLTNADMAFPTVERPDGDTVEISLSNFTKLQKDSDRAFRQEVYEAFYDEWEGVENAVATAYEKTVRRNVKLAQRRNFETAREAAMNGPNVPVEVYDTLVETVRDNLDVIDRHADLKRRALGVDELRMWDLYAPLTDDDAPEIPYDEATDHVVEAVGALGEEYQRRVAEGIDSRWIDVYENRGKRSGAYSGGTYDTQPFVLMNYQDDVASMYTLAHELGHSLHSQLTSEHQPYVYSGYTIFVAEVASTVNEALLTHHLLETVDDPDLRWAVLDEYLERFRGTLFRQTMFAEFEHRTHALVEDGEALTTDRLHELYRELKEAFYESAVVDDRIAREWMRIPHFYSAFYVYQYSTGVSAAGAIARDVLEEGEPAVERYLNFLKRGSRDYPVGLLRDAGVDMTGPEPIERAIETYDSYLDEMDALLD